MERRMNKTTNSETPKKGNETYCDKWGTLTLGKGCQVNSRTKILKPPVTCNKETK